VPRLPRAAFTSGQHLRARVHRAPAGYLPSMTENEQPPTDAGEGYPEDSQPGTGIDPKKHPENEIPDGDAPDGHAPEDGQPGQATGNPQAAGG
jgi:hypothetical protein